MLKKITYFNQGPNINATYCTTVTQGGPSIAQRPSLIEQTVPAAKSSMTS